MALILLIDTSGETAGVALSESGKVVASKINPQQKDHAAWLHPAIQLLMKESGHSLSTLDAVSVTAGPGSYTGLRVGMATAKGLCYALKIPLITVSTLKVMANAGKKWISKSGLPDSNNYLLCPMIDARRMEVFTALFDQNLNMVLDERPIILEEGAFEAELGQSKIIFFGSGSEKLKSLNTNANALFQNIDWSVSDIVELSEERFRDGNFANLAYTEPAYLKEFYTPHKN
jgi:tRNA threonylcarbamoyladenosine biosynthesis protein TsaB